MVSTLKNALFAIGVLFSAVSARPCSLVHEPLTQPSASEAVFFGTVDGISDSGVLHVVDIDPVWPSKLDHELDVGIVQLMATCDVQPANVAELQAKFPAGIRIAVVAAVREPSRTGQTRLEVILGGETSIDRAESASAEFVVRQRLATLERGTDGTDSESIVRSMIPFGEINFGGVVSRYIKDEKSRERLAADCREYWTKWDADYQCRLKD